MLLYKSMSQPIKISAKLRREIAGKFDSVIKNSLQETGTVEDVKTIKCLRGNRIYYVTFWNLNKIPVEKPYFSIFTGSQSPTITYKWDHFDPFYVSSVEIRRLLDQVIETYQQYVKDPEPDVFNPLEENYNYEVGRVTRHTMAAWPKYEPVEIGDNPGEKLRESLKETPQKGKRIKFDDLAEEAALEEEAPAPEPLDPDGESTHILTMTQLQQLSDALTNQIRDAGASINMRRNPLGQLALTFYDEMDNEEIGEAIDKQGEIEEEINLLTTLRPGTQEYNQQNKKINNLMTELVTKIKEEKTKKANRKNVKMKSKKSIIKDLSRLDSNNTTKPKIANNWIKFVKEVQNKFNLSYKEAMIKAKELRNK